MTIALAYAQELLTCLDSALVAQAGVVPVAPVPGQVCLRGGGEYAPMLSRVEDECCDGIAWVRIVQADPWDPGIQLPPNCGYHLRTTTLEMGVVRCAHTPGVDEITSCETWTNQVIRQESDHTAMEAALCCFTDLEQLGDPGITPGTYTPFGPDGNCMGATMLLTIDHACACGTGG